MLMYSLAEKITECTSCRQTLKSNAITLLYDNMYLCKHCYKRKCASEKKNNQDLSPEELEREEDFERFYRQICDRSYFVEHYEFEEKRELLTPKEIVAYLDRNVIGQEAAKKALAVAVCNHQRRIEAGEDSVKIPKSNVLIQGSTGCGKTYILRSLAELLDVPFYIADASLITEASYKGNDVESVITGLYQAANGDIKKTENGIIYLDEFDKLSAKYGNTSSGSSVGAGVQRQMLKMIEGCVMDVPKTGARRSGDSVSINTENILFICGGAFDGINNHKKVNVSHQIGFVPEKNESIEEIIAKDNLMPEDFIEFGIIPEMVGRLPIIVTLSDLSEKDLADVLRYTENSLIKKYQTLFKESYNVELVFHNNAIDEIAHQAYIRHTGARGLNAIVEGVMQELLFEVPSDPAIRKCVINKNVVLGNEKAYFVYDNDVIKMCAS